MTTALAIKDEDAVDPTTDAYLRAQSIVDAINLAKPESLTPIPSDYVFRKQNREAVSVALHAAFQLIGGVPALAQWASKNPEKFFNIWAKLLPTDTLTPVGNQTINFVSAVPASPLDYVNINSTGHVVVDVPDLELPE